MNRRIFLGFIASYIPAGLFSFANDECVFNSDETFCFSAEIKLLNAKKLADFKSFTCSSQTTQIELLNNEYIKENLILDYNHYSSDFHRIWSYRFKDKKTFLTWESEIINKGYFLENDLPKDFLFRKKYESKMNPHGIGIFLQKPTLC
jgi:hypothetical protein